MPFKNDDNDGHDATGAPPRCRNPELDGLDAWLSEQRPPLVFGQCLSVPCPASDLGHPSLGPTSSGMRPVTHGALPFVMSRVFCCCFLFDHAPSQCFPPASLYSATADRTTSLASVKSQYNVFIGSSECCQPEIQCPIDLKNCSRSAMDAPI